MLRKYEAQFVWTSHQGNARKILRKYESVGCVLEVIKGHILRLLGHARTGSEQRAEEE